MPDHISTEPEKLDIASLDIAAQKRDELVSLFPEIRTEGGKIDFDRLKAVLGEVVDAGRERYGMNWPGKAECMRTIQTPSMGTLLPMREESVEWDTTGNVIIEGDNLEVLKLLQKSYLGKVKMIYIDPPYNTGNDFIYPDNFSESLQTYLDYTAQVDGEGRRFGTNTEVDGRFHSKWINMMFPRLYLGRNLLSQNGLICMSIDDNEIQNSLYLMDAVFGEENRIGIFIVNSTPNARDYGHIGKMHEYVVCYAKDIVACETNLIPEEDKKFRFKDELGGFNVHPLYNSNEAFTPENRRNLYYPFYLSPDIRIGEDFYSISLEKSEGSIEIYPPKSVRGNVQFVWRWGKPKALQDLNREIIGYKTEDGEFRIVQKMRHNAKLIRSILSDTSYATRAGTAQIEEIFGSKVYSFPKPVALVKQLLTAGLGKADLVLDFFGGSGTTAQAILELNRFDGGDRKFILVQLPEPCDETSEAFRAGFKTISQITRERVRRVIKANSADGNMGLFADPGPESGFRSFNLAPSNFIPWDGTAANDAEQLANQLQLGIEHTREDRTSYDLLCEVLLKSWGEPALSLKTAEERIEGVRTFSIADGAFLICLESEVSLTFIRALAARRPDRIVMRESAFAGNDQLKTNAVQTFKSHGVVSFKVV